MLDLSFHPIMDVPPIHFVSSDIGRPKGPSNCNSTATPRLYREMPASTGECWHLQLDACRHLRVDALAVWSRHPPADADAPGFLKPPSDTIQPSSRVRWCNRSAVPRPSGFHVRLACVNC